MAAQLTSMNARSARFDRLWIARAISSFPVPVSATRNSQLKSTGRRLSDPTRSPQYP